MDWIRNEPRTFKTSVRLSLEFIHHPDPEDRGVEVLW